MARPSFQRVAMGFSLMTWRPLRATSMACSECRPDGVVSTTMSAVVSFSMSVSEA